MHSAVNSLVMGVTIKYLELIFVLVLSKLGAIISLK